MGNNNQLEDIILVAPYIHFESNFKGSLQAIARDSILVENGVYLKFPSALGLVKKRGNNEKIQPFIKLLNKSKVEGAIFTHQIQKTQQETKISITKNAKVTGQVYADGWAEIKGNITGSLTCNKLILKTPSSVYENHLLNATINKKALPSNFVGSGLLNARKNKKMIKRLE